MFTAEQKTALAAPLDRKHVKTRKQAGRELSYVEGWQAISEANRIFGFDSWTSETVELRCVAERERKIGQPPRERDGWGVSYVARVRVVVFAGDSLVTREGVGSGHGIDVDLGQAHESAVKEAETDARKRALMTFGNPFGLALYDKEQAQVCDTPPAESTAVKRLLAGIQTVKEKDGATLADLKAWYAAERNTVAVLSPAEKDTVRQAYEYAQGALTPNLLQAG